MLRAVGGAAGRWVVWGGRWCRVCWGCRGWWDAGPAKEATRMPLLRYRQRLCFVAAVAAATIVFVFSQCSWCCCCAAGGLLALYHGAGICAMCNTCRHLGARFFSIYVWLYIIFCHFFLQLYIGGWVNLCLEISQAALRPRPELSAPTPLPTSHFPLPARLSDPYLYNMPAGDEAVVVSLVVVVPQLHLHLHLWPCFLCGYCGHHFCILLSFQLPHLGHPRSIGALDKATFPGGSAQSYLTHTGRKCISYKLSLSLS